MESSCSRLMVLSLAHATLILIGVSSNGITMASSSQFTAMFCFGDSLIDNGNNNYLTSLAKANYVPYGVDFYEGPSGRFSNGRTIIDYLGDLVGIPYLPAFANPLATGRSNIKFKEYVDKMPTLHRLSVFRDDVIFLIYLYQRWVYPVDKKRVNEFGFAGEDENQASASAEITDGNEGEKKTN
ncbi:transmembrane CLPTM1 family protein [Actinidia rufa]|uniref:Transmembrane CLPTM1 family protein n=1 Tax=Actinidia rufa TaxID=165716 RepID=A0A7J0H6I2_9ERIC|nr:transmembrane CLPTM1 family protein [Actinidia rufa]